VANGGTGVTSSTGSGSVVLSASPTFTGTVQTSVVQASGNGVYTLGQVRATGWYNTPTGSSYTGLAAEIGMSGGQGYMLCYNRDTGTYGVLNLSGSASNLQISGSTVNVNSGSLQQGGSQVLTAGNYTSYSPSLTGTGASGTWGISVTGSSASCTGNAATATTATSATSSTYAYRTAVDTAPAVIINSDGTYYGQVARRTTQQWGMGWGSGVGQATTFGIYYDTSGNFTATANVTAYSDERLKTNWRDVSDDYVEQLANIKHGVYDRTDTDITQAGVSAQSWQTLLPETVETDTLTGTLSVAYGNAALVSAVQLAKRVVEQDERIAKLEALVAKLTEGK
jgi:hypothetical protein